MVESRYRALIEAAAIVHDPEQERAVTALNRLYEELEGYRPEPAARRGLFGKRPALSGPGPHGVYLHGGVGRGKSMLMDLFHQTVSVERKRRAHFHDFMLDVHARLHARRQSHPREGEPIKPLADVLAADAWLLCFDEFHVTNIADAMILGRLFDALFERGVVVVATSNWAPDRLYEGGLQRPLFLPFIARLKERMAVVSLEGERDYRLDRVREFGVYHAPLGPHATQALQATFDALTEGDDVGPTVVEVGSRRLAVPRASFGVAWFAFEDLCEEALGAADYLALADRFHTLVLEDVPRLTPDKRNEARRFVTLVDALYERGMHLVCSADGAPDELYPDGEGAFEFQRTVSRLMEMQSADYVEKARERARNAGPFEPFALTSDL
ncbi:MAG: cell division protein ZapE [Pseudomonadota bacterium]